MAILARASFMDMDLNRLWGAGLMIGDAEWVFAFSYGSELRKAWDAGEAGVSGAAHDDCAVCTLERPLRDCDGM
jgi:hypothetical protein